MLHNFTYKLKVNLTNKKKCLLRGNYSKSASDAHQLSPDANRHLRYNIYTLKIITRVRAGPGFHIIMPGRAGPAF